MISTSDSLGIQTNALQGGMKRDLSLLFEQIDAAYNDAGSSFMQALSNEGLVYTNAPGAKSTLPLIFSEPITGAVNGEIYGPTWDMLRDYYRLYKGVAASASSSPTLPDDWVHSYAPVKAWFTDQLRCAAAVDDGIGRIVEVLKERGTLDNTLIVFTSDNGYFHMEHRRLGQTFGI